MAGYSAALRNAFDLSDFHYIKTSLREIGEMTDMQNIGLFKTDGEPSILGFEKDPSFIKDARQILENFEHYPNQDPVWTFKYKTQHAGTILRNITILPNQGSCLKCHHSDGPILGFLMADFSTKKINRHFIMHILQVMLAAIVSVFVMIIVLRVVLKKMIQQPLDQITAGLNGISVISGRIKQIEHHSQDEIGGLVDAINALAEQHDYNKEELAAFYDGSYDPFSPLDYEMKILASTKVADVIEQEIETMYDNMTIKDVLSFMKGSSHTFFPVINQWSEFKGVITLQDVRNVLMDPSMSSAMMAKDFMNSDASFLQPNQDLKSAMDLFNANRVSYLSVVEETSGIFLGILARRKLLEILKQGFLKSVGI